uniref:Polycystic kidney disease 1 like 2a n=1 Tax=Myripristis murdjan TaxID=586833 RepID=A0A667YRT0_9TELE
MYRPVPFLPILVTLSCLSRAEVETEAAVSCPESQQAFGGSCYEFVSEQHSFLGAQAWCELSGGHLAFILNEETQYFLQEHIDPERDWWLGLAPPAFPNLQDSTAVEDALSWLNGSHVSYSNWVRSPRPGSGCGHIVRNSGFQWEATGDCGKKLHFVCQFESGRSIVCAGHNATLQCGTGQIIEIDGAFYGRKTGHYCRSGLPPPAASTQGQCGWVDVVDSLAGYCHGRQVCQAIAAVDSFAEPCPGLGSYLSVDYHCEDGLKLSVSKLAAVFDNVTISVKWLLHSFGGNLTCKLSTGDGHIIYLHSPEWSESIVVHKYIHPSVFVLVGFGVIKCFTRSLSLEAANCKAFYGRPFEIQYNVTYKIQSGEALVSSSSVVRGIVPRTSQLAQSGADALFFRGYPAGVCGWRMVAGLQASVEVEGSECPPSPHLSVGVSLRQGAPVLLLFFLTGDSSSFSETREMTQNEEKKIYHIRNPIQGIRLGLEAKWVPKHIESDEGSRVKTACQRNKSNSNKTYSRLPCFILVLPYTNHLCLTCTDKDSLGVYTTYTIEIPSSSKNPASPTKKPGTSVTTRKPGNGPGQRPDMAAGATATGATAAGATTAGAGGITKTTTTAATTKTPTAPSGGFGGLSCSISPPNGTVLDAFSITCQSGISCPTCLLCFETSDSEYSSKLKSVFLPAGESSSNYSLTVKATVKNGTMCQHHHYYTGLVTARHLQTQSINIPLSSSAKFSLPSLPANIIPSEEPVDVRMLNLKKNPFSWSGSGNISGLVGALSLTREDGSNIPVGNLTEDVEILLPRPAGELVSTSVLDLRNYSTVGFTVPSPESTLVLKIEPSEDPLPFMLLLGHEEYPTSTNYVAMTRMPQQGATQEERYTWLLEPKDLKGNTGKHYLLVRPIVGPGIKTVNASLSITSIASHCKYWDESKSDWSDYGCRVGVQTTSLVTQCLCTHLTFFGSSFFVTPNLIDLSRTAELFGTFAENPVVVCFVGALFVAYLIVVVWARRKDIQDRAKVNVTVLKDNDPRDEYRYILSVSTGHRQGASTSSQVTITLLGTEGDSEPHHLTNPKTHVFERGGVDMFMLTTPFSLGQLQSIRLWHNNSGRHPDWYVNKVLVQDLQTEQKWHFLCNSWLGIDVGDCTVDKVFPVATEMDLQRFSNLFFMKTAKDFSDGHLWFSVISRPPSSTFTRVQRVSCCFSLLLCTMLTSLMFWGIPTDPSEQTMDLGHFEFTWQQFMIGVQSSLIMFPVNLFIVSIFRNVRPHEMSCIKAKPDSAEQENTSHITCSQSAASNMEVNGITLDTVIKDITRIAHSLSKTVKSNIPQSESEFGPGQEVDISAVLTTVEDFIRQNNKTGDTSVSTLSKTQGSHSLIQTQLPEGSVSAHRETAVEGIEKKSNKTQYLYRQLCHIDKELSLLGSSGFPDPDSYDQAVQQVQGMKGLLEDQLFTSSCKMKRVCCQGGLPWWFVFVGWLLIIVTSCVAGFFTMLYGLKFGKERSISWLISMVVSFFQSLLIIQPLKVLCFAVFFSLVLKKVEEEVVYENLQFVKADTNLDNHKVAQTISRDSRVYQPPSPVDIDMMRRNKIKEKKAFALIWEILTYMGFMWMLLLVAYGQRDQNAFFLNRHVQQSFRKGISDSMSLRDVFTWANTSLLSNLFGIYPGFITDGNSKLVGNARFRQVRVQKSSCKTARPLLQFVPDCHAPYSWEDEDMGSYGSGWNGSVADNSSQSPPDPWMYQTQAQLRAHPIWGKVAFYRGGGFVVELGPDLQNASSTLQHLFENTWLDMYTRAIFVEFTVYNANVNLFCIVTLLLETTAIGAFQFRSEQQSVRLYQFPGGFHIFVLAAEIIYYLFILYYMFLQGKLMKQQRWAYFRSMWNLLELAIILISWIALAVFITRTLLGDRNVNYYHNHKDQFASFHETATADSVLRYVIAFLVLLATVKLWHLFRLNSKVNLITATLQRAWTEISGFLMIMLIMFLAYSITSNLLYGGTLSSYTTLMDALLTMISLQLGIFNYEEVLNYNLFVSALLIGSCVVFMTFVVLNLLISVILVALSHEQIHHKPSDEEEIVDMMLTKLCSLFGITYKEATNSSSPEVNGSPDSARNNGRGILNNSLTDPNTF